MAKAMLLLPPLLFFAVLTFSEGVSFKTVLRLQQFHWEEKWDVSRCLSPKSRRENGAAILEIKHRDNCQGEPVDWNKKLQERLSLDDQRVRSFQSRMKNMVSGNIKAVSNTEIPLTSGVDLGILNYIVSVELGGQKMTVIVDTGSDLTWVQCQPCKMCYNQRDPLFNPATSSSYQTVLCNSSTCQDFQVVMGNRGACGSTPTCDYVVGYGDGSYTHGELGRGHLNLGSGSQVGVDNFVFGCGRNDRGLFGGASGLMGLGRSSISLVSQTAALFGGFFSYCLPATDTGASGSLILGRNSSVYKTSTPITYTRMIPNPQLSTFYFLNLTSITVGGVALQTPSFGNAAMLIDSGTVITRLPPTIYKAFKAEFLKQFSEYPTAPSFSILDTCFNLSTYQEVDIPTIKLQFEGKAEMTVDVNGILYFVKTDASQVCLALSSLSYEDEVGIVGNYQQRNQRVIYDTQKSKLGFAPESCSFT
ncbi:hypothetical protein SLE2022_380550 [Rubroshorea leprosula]